MRPAVTPDRDHLTAYLRARVRDEAGKLGVRPYARLVGLSHPIILGILKGTHGLSRADTVERLCLHLGHSLPEAYAAAAAWARTHPAEVAAERPFPPDLPAPAAAPTLGSHPDWPAAEAEARRRAPWVPESAWSGARAIGYAAPRISPELAIAAAQLVLAGG